MTTKTEYTNEQIAEALEVKFDDWYCPICQQNISGYAVTYHETHEKCGAEVEPGTPDFQNDLNACFKYVWPEIEILVGDHISYIKLQNILYNAFITDNPATALCQAFMDLRKEKTE